MATAKTGRKGLAVLLAAVALLAALMLLYRESVSGYAQTGAAFGARTTCACRYVAGRAMGDCKKDFEPGMQAVFVSEDADEKSVTAYVPLLAMETARFRPGYGCLLERWEG